MSSSRKPAVLPALLFGACAWAALMVRQGPGFTVLGAAPQGLGAPQQAPRAEIPSAPSAGQLGGATLPGGEGMLVNKKPDMIRGQDPGYVTGEEAYVHPPPIPTEFAGLDYPSTMQAHCDRVYRNKYKVCIRYKENTRRMQDCKYDAFRWRRTCYWKARPEKIHPKFYQKKRSGGGAGKA
eukprot:gb/GFBE01001863.1/.p1 GENE.gb/GFBE01001863.1/~~gb/GFBE01001863.1/.p1  ORF type:complete len:180 (+),score=40.77 gb/GFBE01001863.1/:1-540(+)